ncbi:MAG: outer-membrane lipoprotein carrier protein LolA [Endomicrobium sp.]|jgi:outer membrane lipoprotein-sorting protein|nr:outer-membrane lipoprotein carrier protein LolA [Endomicrobium sp.]
MKIGIAAAMVLALAFFAPSVFAQSNEEKLKDVLAKMEEADKAVKTFETDYSQEIFYTATGEKQLINGNLKYKKPDGIFITQKAPQEQKIYISGGKITVYTPENDQAVIDDWKNMINGDFAPASLISFGSGWKDIQKNNAIDYAAEDEDNYILEIYPNSKKEWTMQIYVSKKTFYPVKAIVLSGGISVNVSLANVKTNQNFKKDIFKFKAPEGVEVIKL